MKATALDGLFYWSRFQPDRGIDFNGFYWDRAGGAVLIDPMPLDGELPGSAPSWIVLTNADHLRAAPELRERFGARLWAPSCDRQRLAGVAVDGWFGEAEPLPDELARDIEVRWIRGGKTDAEAVLVLVPLRAVVFGDAVRSHASGVLRLLPDAKLADRESVVDDVRALGDLNPDAILLGDGDCLFRGARDALADLRAGLVP